jgi:hypothetical protein
MDAGTTLWQLLGLFAVPAGTGVLAATGAWWLWRGPGAARRWARLAAWSAAAASATAVLGLVGLGHDGQMLTYAAVVLACTLTLGWLGRTRRP